MICPHKTHNFIRLILLKRKVSQKPYDVPKTTAICFQRQSQLAPCLRLIDVCTSSHAYQM
jgi:hypothetical protein